MTQENPYTNLLGLMRDQGAKNNPTVCVLGKIVSVSPLKIQAGGVELSDDDLLVNSSLKSGYERKIDFSGTVCEVSGASGTATTTKAAYAVGDTALLIPSADQQQYYFICVLEAP